MSHSGTTVTELIYRKQIRPVLDDGAKAMDRTLPVSADVGTQATTNGLEKTSSWSL